MLSASRSGFIGCAANNQRFYWLHLEQPEALLVVPGTTRGFIGCTLSNQRASPFIYIKSCVVDYFHSPPGSLFVKDVDNFHDPPGSLFGVDNFHDPPGRMRLKNFFFVSPKGGSAREFFFGLFFCYREMEREKEKGYSAVIDGCAKSDAMQEAVEWFSVDADRELCCCPAGCWYL